MVTVFEYEYFDQKSGGWRRGARLATAERIAKLGAVLLASTRTAVPAPQVGVDGFVCMGTREPSA